ncbi:MAG: hypothetical protein ACLGI6_09905 [Gammaproteobacteria bacterium]
MQPPPAATTLANAVLWSLTLAENHGAELLLTMQLPSETGTVKLNTVISTGSGATMVQYGPALDLGLTVVGSSQNYGSATNHLTALKLTAKKELDARKSVMSEIDLAMQYLAHNTSSNHEIAIGKLVNASDLLLGITSVDTSAARLDVDRIMKEAEWRWSTLQRVQ